MKRTDLAGCEAHKKYIHDCYACTRAALSDLLVRYEILEISESQALFNQQAALEAKEAELDIQEHKARALRDELTWAYAESSNRTEERDQARLELAEMTALKDKAAEMAIAIGFEHNVKVEELTAVKAELDQWQNTAMCEQHLRTEELTAARSRNEELTAMIFKHDKRASENLQDANELREREAKLVSALEFYTQVDLRDISGDLTETARETLAELKERK